MSLQSMGVTFEELSDALDSLERLGLIKKSGQFRMSSDGTLEPCWVPTDKGRLLHPALSSIKDN